MMLSLLHTAQYQMTGLFVTVSQLKAKTLGHEAEVLTTELQCSVRRFLFGVVMFISRCTRLKAMLRMSPEDIDFMSKQCQ